MVGVIIKVWIFACIYSTLNPLLLLWLFAIRISAYTCLFVCSLSITSVVAKVVVPLLLLVVVVVVAILYRKLPCCKRKHVNLLGCHSVNDWLFCGSLSRYCEQDLSTGLYKEKEGTCTHILISTMASEHIMHGRTMGNTILTLIFSELNYRLASYFYIACIHYTPVLINAYCCLRAATKKHTTAMTPLQAVLYTT